MGKAPLAPMPSQPRPRLLPSPYRRRPLGAAGLVLLALLTLSRSGSAREILHEVATGHTLGAIAKRYGTTVEAIEQRNALAPGDLLHPGQKLRIEVEETTATRRSTKPAKAVEHREPPRRRTAKHRLGFGEAARQTNSTATADAAPTLDRSTSSRRASQGSLAAGLALARQFARKPPQPGFVTVVRFSERFSGRLVDDRRRLIPSAHRKISRLLRDLRTRQMVPIDQRLLRMLADVSDHFGGRPLIVVSGFRMYDNRQHTADSRHNYGQAIDFRIAAVPNAAVRAYCLRFGDVGVGYYPNSSFVHFDARDRKAAWIDTSGPGEAPRYAQWRARAGKAASRRRGTTGQPPTKAPRRREAPASAKHPGPAAGQPVVTPAGRTDGRPVAAP